MADDRKLRIVIKDHECNRVGEVAAFESFVSVSRVNDVGEATLVAGYGASDDNDDVLDSLDTADMILEAYIKPPGHTTFMDDPAWAGFLRDARIEQTGPSRVGTYVFRDYNHLLTRRVVVPPEGGSHDEHYGTTSNIMRDLVREHAAENAEEERQIPGLSVEANDDVDTPGLYSDTTALVFGAGLPEYVRVNDLFVWNGWLYLGTETEPDSDNYAGIYRSADGTTWTQVMDGTSPVEGLYGYPITSINCFCEFDGWLYAGCSQDWEDGEALVMRTFNGEDWSLAATFPNLAGIWSLAEFDGDLYAGTTGDTDLGSETYLWSSADGLVWVAAADAQVSWGVCPSLGSRIEHIRCSALYTWGSHLYLGTMYKYATSVPGWKREEYEARIYRTDDGTTITEVLGVVSAHEFLSFIEWGDYLYAGSGRTRWDSFPCVSNQDYGSGGRIYRSTSGAAWTQVFGGNLDSTHYSAAISDMMVSTDSNGEDALWAASGWRKGGSARIYYSLDGETWTLGANITTIPYAFTLALVLFLGENYAGMGCYAHAISDPGLGDDWSPDHGDVWRVVLSAGDLAESGATGRWGTLLDKLREIAEQSGNHDFGIVGKDSLLYCDIYQTFEFRVRYPQWGTDNRWDGTQGLSFSIQRGNMDQPEYATIRGSRPNYLYLLGPSSGEERTIDEYPDAVSMSESPWNRIEGTANAQAVDTASARNSMGWSELELQGPYREFQFQALETEICYFPDTWKLGDLVSASFAGVLAECKIQEVAIMAMEGAAVYTIQPTFRALSVEVEATPDVVIAGSFARANLAGASAHISYDDGATWEMATRWTTNMNETWDMIEHSRSGYLFAAVGSGTGGALGEIWRSTNRGVSWQRVEQHASERYFWSLVEAANGDILAGTATTGEFWRSQDNGDTWAKVDQTAANRTIWCMARADNGDLLAGCNLREVYRSQDDGANWALVDTLAPSFETVIRSMITLSDGTMLCGTGFGRAEIWQSTDNGATWVYISNLPSEENCFCFAESEDGSTVFAGSGNETKVHRSYDGGVTWNSSDRLCNSGVYVRSLAVLANGDILAGTDCDDGVTDVANVYRSQDDGATWAYFSQIAGTPDNEVNTLLVLSTEGS